MDGWIKLHRKMLDWEWYNDNNTKILFLHLLLTANHKEKRWHGKIIERGQKLTSLQHLAEETNLSKQQVRTSLDKLKLTHEITLKTTSRYTLVTIEKYSDYQDNEENCNTQVNTENNNQITNKQHTNNTQITLNKNDKNIKNEKNEKNIKKEKKKKETDFDKLINENFSDEKLKTTVYDFIKMRKAVNKPLTTRGLELMIEKLYKLSQNIDEQIQILNNSIMNNWLGIFPLKKDYKKTNKGSFDDFREIWEEARIEDEQTRNGTNNNPFSW